LHCAGKKVRQARLVYSTDFWCCAIVSWSSPWSVLQQAKLWASHCKLSFALKCQQKQQQLLFEGRRQVLQPWQRHRGFGLSGKWLSSRGATRLTRIQNRCQKKQQFDPLY
jgi:hypothetical protein